MDPSFRLIDFNIKNDPSLTPSSKKGDKKQFIIQMFGMDEEGKTYATWVEGFQPFFYVKLPETSKWTELKKRGFVEHIRKKVGDYYRGSITKCSLIKKKKLYGFDAGKEYQFIEFMFTNKTALNKVKNLWYDNIPDEKSRWGSRRVLRRDGYRYQGHSLRIYETSIPPLLRYFHIQNISPSGWVTFPKEKAMRVKHGQTTCDYEYRIHYKHIVEIPQKENQVPLKICSFDIEASSSHGDFPLPKKTYEKLVIDILDYWDREEIPNDEEGQQDILRKIILTAFKPEGWGEEDNINNIHILHLKYRTPSWKALNEKIERWLLEAVRTQSEGVCIEDGVRGVEDETEDFKFKRWWRNKPKKKDTILDLLNNKKFDRGDKLDVINKTFVQGFPPIKGDKVTFIGSTFMKLGGEENVFESLHSFGRLCVGR